MRNVLHLLIVLVIFYALYAAFLTASQSRIIFPGKGIPAQANLAEAFTFADYLHFQTSHGKMLACYLPAAKDGPVAIVAHGNAETIGQWADIVRDLHSIGLSVLLVEFPGYGGSEGTPSKESISETFIAAYDWLKSNSNTQNRKIIGLGRSLGTGVISHLGEERSLDGVVMFSPFVSLDRMALRMGVLPFLLKTRYDNARFLKSFQGPVMICHGESDRIIPASHGRKLAHSREGIEFLSVAAGHNDLWSVGSEITASLQKWLQANELAASHP